MEWIEKEEVAPSWLGFLIARCSKCGKYVCTPTVNHTYFKYKYCPHCGEKEKENGNDTDNDN